MKITSFKSLIGSSPALAVVVAVLSSLNASAQVKGAQLLLRPAVLSQAAAPATPAMSCPKCKSEFTSQVDGSVRGAIKPVITAERHLCPACESGKVVVGAGKNSPTVTVHSCGSCGSQAATKCDSMGMGM